MAGFVGQVGFVGWVGFVGLAGLPPPAAAAPALPAIQEAGPAWVHSRPFDSIRIRQDGKLVPGLRLPSPDDPAAWRPVRLPVRQQAQDTPPGRSFRPQVWWYRFDYTVPADVDGPLALYAPRVVGGAVQVVRHEAGQWSVAWDGLERWREQWNCPVFVELGTAPPAGTTLRLALGVILDPADGHQLSAVRMGPRPALAGQEARRRLLQQTLPLAGSFTLLALGGLALLHWARRRGGAGCLLFFGSALAAALHGLHYAVELPADETAYLWFGWASRTALGWSVLLAGLLALRQASRRRPGVQRALVALLAVASALSMPLPGSPWSAALPWYALDAALAVGLAAWLTHVARREGAATLRAVVVGLWAGVLMGLHDLLLAAGWLPAESYHLLPLATVVLLLALVQSAYGRFAGALDRLRRVHAHLDDRVAGREALLRARHERVCQEERAQALQRERERLLRDMHDGLGATLVSTLALAESGRLAPEAVAAALRDCVDDLRLVVDSLAPAEHDVVAVLASLRQRLGRRLASAGLALDWQVQELPPLPWLEPPDALQLLRIVQEALTNVLKHSQARRVRISTRATGAGVRVEVEDDGRGFDPHGPSAGRGLRHLQQRADRLGGRLRVHGRPGGGTRVVLELPLQRPPPS